MHINQNTCSKATWHYSYYGPTFGGGRDFHIAGDANSNSESYSNPGVAYDLSPGQTKTFLVGSKNFKV